VLARDFEVEGLDIDPRMVAFAAERCPEARVHHTDMSDFDLGRRFDVVVSLFSSIGYVRTLDRMRAATACMARHLNPGGVLVIEPWFTPDSYWVDRLTVNRVDREDLQITWMYVSRREDLLSVLDIHYLVGTPRGVEHLEERHLLGLFTTEEHQQAIAANDLRPEHDPVGLYGRGLHIGTHG
jgi:SAM-dependent methyltransferase